MAGPRFSVRRIALAVGWAWGLVGCNGSTSPFAAMDASGSRDDGGTDAGDGGAETDGDGGPLVPLGDAATTYLAPPATCVLPDAGMGCGWLCGDGVSATICGVEGMVQTRASVLAADGVGPSTLLQLGNAGVVISFGEPADATDGTLIGYVAVNAAPGVYTSGEELGCSDFSVNYYLPVPASVECGDASGPSCPPGCSSVCSGFGCAPCTPNAPGVLYVANTVDPLCNGGSNESPTDGGERAGAGSWTVTLTSVGPAGTSSGATAYPVHGTLSAELVGEGPDGGAIGSAALFLVF